MLLAVGPPVLLGGGDGVRLQFAEGAKSDGAWAGSRLLTLDDKPAFKLSFWCGTCPFLFERLGGANETLSLESVQDALAEGLTQLDAGVVDAFAALLPRGTYVPMLLEILPRLAYPSGDGDYFASEQVTTWGIDPFWGLPGSPRTPYYRTFSTAVTADAHLYEFVVPMVPPTWNEPERVQAYRAQLKTSSRPTAVAVATLDVCQPAMDNAATDYYAHWGLTHFLLDGHHKMQAAAETEQPLQLLTLLSIEGSLASPAEVADVPKLRGQSSSERTADRA